MELLPPITADDKPAGKKRGRKPGGGKVPGSGRQPGTKNRVVADVREMILARGKPIELLCDISRGVKVRVGPQAGPGVPQYSYPTLQERAAAAKILLDKLVPAAPAAPSGLTDGAPPEAAPEMSDRELASRIAFALTKGVHDAGKTMPHITQAAIDLKPVDPFADQRAAQAAEIAAAAAQPEGDTKLSDYAAAAAAQRAERDAARAEGRLERPVPVWVDENRRPRAIEDFSPATATVTRFRPRTR